MVNIEAGVPPSPGCCYAEASVLEHEIIDALCRLLFKVWFSSYFLALKLDSALCSEEGRKEMREREKKERGDKEREGEKEERKGKERKGEERRRGRKKRVAGIISAPQSLKLFSSSHLELTPCDQDPPC